MSNGCGCESGILKYIRPPHAKMFYAACVKHDNAYDWGGDAEARKRADKELFRDCMKISSRRTKNALKRLYFACIAILYYVSVRIFGWIYFKWQK